jgi:PAS domain S-box-containing protein
MIKMHSDPDNVLENRLKRWSEYLIVAVLGISLVVLTAWIFWYDFFKHVFYDLVAVNPVTATCFILLSVSFFLLDPAKKIRVASFIGIAGASLVLLVGLLKIADHFSIVEFKLDDLLSVKRIDLEREGNRDVGMAICSPYCLVIASVALLFLTSRIGWKRQMGQVLAMVPGLAGLLVLIGYLYQVASFNGIFDHLQMALFTSVNFLLISIALIFRSPDTMLMQETMGNLAGSNNLRTMLPVAIVVPVALGLLRLLGLRAGLFSEEFSVAVLVLSIIIVLIVLIWYQSRLLNNRERKRIAAENTMWESETRLRLFVNSVKDYVIFMVDPNGYIISASEGVESITGYSSAEIQGRHISIFYQADEILAGDPGTNLRMAAATGRFEKEGWSTRKDGSLFWANVVYAPVFDHQHQLKGFAKVTRNITEKKMAEQQLRKFNAELESKVNEKTAEIREVFERVTDNFVALDRDYRFTYVNKKAEEFHQIPSSEMIGKNIFEIFPETKGSLIQQSLLEAMRKQERIYIEGQDSHSGKWLAINIFPSPNGSSIFFRDITTNKLAQQALKEREEKYKTLFDEAADGILVFSGDEDRYLETNRKMSEFLGYSRDEILAMTIADLTAPGDLEAKPVKYAELNQGTTVITERLLKRKDGSVVNAEVNTRKLPNGNFLTFVRDITERKMAEEIIRASEHKYRLLFNNNPLPMIMMSIPDLAIVDVNGAAIEHYGYSREEFIALDSRKMRPPEDVENLMKELEIDMSERKNRGIWRHIRKDGTLIYVEIIATDFIYEGRKVRLLLCNDVSEKLKAEENLKRSYEEIRHLASHLQDIREEERAGIAREIHDELGQQLTGLKMDMSWFSKRIPAGDDKQLRQKFASTIGLLNDTIKAVRRISTKLHPSILDDLGLLAAIDWQSQEFEKRTGIKTVFCATIEEFDFPSSMAIGLFRICQESLTNIARYASAKNVLLSLYQEGDQVVLKIADDGKGFDTTRARTKKTLGLLGMRERAQMMGAEFDLFSKEGKGTSLLVKVPVASIMAASSN